MNPAPAADPGQAPDAPPAARSTFAGRVASALRDASFIRLTLGKPRPGQSLLKVVAEIVTTGSGARLQLQFHHRQRDLTQAATPDAILAAFAEHFGTALGSAHLHTSAAVWQLEQSRKGVSRLTRGPAPHDSAAPRPHDRPKIRPVAPADAPWLQALGLAGADGRIRSEMTGKFRQINRYVELLRPLCTGAGLLSADPARPLRAFDLGSGKGYLTFAAWHALTGPAGRPVEMTGVEVRPELVAFCNRVAAETACTGLHFVAGKIADTSLPEADLFIALHACDTATDDALFRGIRAGAALILAAPCCHKEVRPQLQVPPDLSPLGRHGIFADRLAEMVTDTLRGLLLEAHGYRVKVCEFISSEHTPKNTLLAATRRSPADPSADTAARLAALAWMDRFGLARQRLADLLALRSPHEPAAP